MGSTLWLRRQTQGLLKVLRPQGAEAHSGSLTLSSGQSCGCSRLETKTEPARMRLESDFSGCQPRSKAIDGILHASPLKVASEGEQQTEESRLNVLKLLRSKKTTKSTCLVFIVAPCLHFLLNVGAAQRANPSP